MSTRPAAAVITVSDGVANGTRDDASGAAAEQLLREAGFDVAARAVVPDERPAIESLLRDLAGSHVLVVTTGGTGFGPRDVTPEATRAVLDREAPGLAELMRREGLATTPMAALSRAVAGSLGAALILNLPGSPKGVRESLEAVLPVVPHAVQLLGGATGAHPTGHADPADTEGSDGTGSDPPGGSTRVEATAVKAVGNPPCEVGARMSIVPGGEIHGTLGCAEFDAAAVRAAAEVVASGRPETRTLHHDLGDIDVFFQPHVAAPRAAVVSATDVARALRSHLGRLGFRTVLVEPRADRITPQDRPAVAAIGDLDLEAYAAVILTDHDAPGVTDTLAALLRSTVGFVGVMGSRRHVGHYVDALRAQGFSDEDLARIRSPLGLDLGGRAPEEIALSIAAGVVAHANGRDGGWLDR
jgi:molybdopterin adenylyltransferase